MSVPAITPPALPYHQATTRATGSLTVLRPGPSTKDTVSGVASRTLEKGSQYLETGKKLADGVIHIVIGCLFGIGSGIATTLAKDNTAIDIISKLGLVGAAVLFLQGAWKLVKSAGKDTAKKVLQDPAVVVSDAISIASKDAYNKVKEIDKSYDEPKAKTPSRIASYDMNDAKNVRDKAYGLFDSYKSGIEYLRPRLDVVDRKEGQSVAITNFADTPKSLLDVQYENALLVGYITASREQSYDTDPLCKNLSGVLEPGGISETNSDLFPVHFNGVYTNARVYDEYHRTKNDSVKEAVKLPTGIDKIEDLAGVLNGPECDNKNKAIEYLQSVQNTRNNLKTLEKAIDFAKLTNDTTKKKPANLLRAALVTAFRLQGNEGQITQSFNEIVNGVSGTQNLTGLSNKIKEFDEFYTKIESLVLQNCTNAIEKTALPSDDIFSSDLGLAQLQRK